MAQKEEYSYTMLAKLLIVFLIVHLLAVIALILMFSAEHEQASSVLVPVSSVWCSGNELKTRRCFFKHLCYSHAYDDFVFVRGKESVMQGLPANRHHPVADMSGGVEQHGNSAYYFNFIDIPEKVVRKENLSSTILPDRVVIFRRFKPDNLMHVFHDDLLPLYFTLNELEHSGAKDYRVFFTDDYGEGKYWELYRLFRSRTFLNSHHPLLKAAVKAEGHSDSKADLICFATAAVGGIANTRWYQYGFDRPQGPAAPISLSGQNVRTFTEAVRKGLEIPKYDIDRPRYTARTRQKHPYVVLLTRKTNRRITNEEDLSVAIAGEFSIRCITFDLNMHSLAEVVHLLENATMLISVHGGNLILSMFLPENAIVMEIFPYGIPAENYTPYRSLAGIPGMNLIYRAWENKNPRKTWVYPKNPPEYGGIIHLPMEEQEKINNTIPVAPHKCCTDPAFLYRIYQDTEVDIPSFLEFAREAMEMRNKTMSVVRTKRKDLPLSPGPVRQISCTYLKHKDAFHIDWEPPWNLKFLAGKNMTYVLKLQRFGENSFVPYESLEHHMEIPVNGSGTFLVWIACQLDQVSGLMSQKPGKCIKE